MHIYGNIYACPITAAAVQPKNYLSFLHLMMHDD